MKRVRIIGPGRAGRSLHLALDRAGWPVQPLLGRDDDPSDAASGVDLVIIATPDAAVRDVAERIEPAAGVVVAHVSGSLGLAPLAAHRDRTVIHPLVALPDPDRGAERLVGAWFGIAADGHPLAMDVVAAVGGRAIDVAEHDWVRYHAAAVIASNHLVALLGQVERVAAGVGAPVEAFLDLARGSLDDVAVLGPAAALTGPVRRGDLETVARHLAAIGPDEAPAYEAMSREAGRLCP